MKTHRSKPNFISKPPARVQTMAKKYGILELPNTEAGSSYEAESSAIFSSMGTEPDTTRKGYINDLVKGLKDDGIWANLDRLFGYASHASDSSLLDWVHPSVGGNYASLVSAPTFQVDRGYNSNGTSSYINTNFNPGDGGSYNFLQDDAMIYFYSRTEHVEGNAWQMGVWDGTQGIGMVPRYSATEIRSMANSGLDITAVGDDTCIGGFILSRDNSLNYNYARNGGTFEVITETSVGISNKDIYDLCTNGSSGASGWVISQHSFWAAGSSLTQTQATALNTRIETFMDAIGYGVQ